LRLGARDPILASVSRVEILVAIVGLLFLEICHLKWIVWEYWTCRTHAVKNSECRCKARLMLFL
jgi:hypothetical protein